ncbi:hypothetical protein QJS66_20955 [Kocuria rhizophila]|nr:hypothetical protein QJS66_20955 [Kocuria rhizophila]
MVDGVGARRERGRAGPAAEVQRRGPGLRPRGAPPGALAGRGDRGAMHAAAWRRPCSAGCASPGVPQSSGPGHEPLPGGGAAPGGRHRRDTVIFSLGFGRTTSGAHVHCGRFSERDGRRRSCGG